MRIAMWSGPRNLSTAMMYAFAQRADTMVWDEPFYAAYLAQTGLDHPLRNEVLAAGETDPALVADLCATGPLRGLHHYQKHMTHHMIDGFPMDWLNQVQNVFLVRHPGRVVASYVKKREAPTLDDIGFVQQVAIFDQVQASGQTAVVIESEAVRVNPDATLRRLCDALGLEFDPAMLSWPKGGKASDGAWAPHWYTEIHQSTGFAGPDADLPTLNAEARRLVDAAMPYYTKLLAHTLGP